MNDNRGFILIETMLALFFVLLLGVSSLRLLSSASNIHGRGQSLLEASQIAAQAIGGDTIISGRYTVQKQSVQKPIAAGVIIQTTVISIYDSTQDKHVLSFVVYE